MTIVRFNFYCGRQVKSKQLEASDTITWQESMITRNEVKMLVFAVAGTAFILAGLLCKTINTAGGKPYQLKWYHRLLAVCMGVNAIIIAIQLYGKH
jgi:hypothetical protein